MGRRRKMNQTDISNIEDQVLSMYVKGMTTRDISTCVKIALKPQGAELEIIHYN